MIADILTNIRSVFAEAAVPENAVPMQAYMKNIAPFMGIKAPVRKTLQKEISIQYKHLSAEEKAALMRSLLQEPQREFHYLAMDWCYHDRKNYTPQSIALLEEMLTTKSWWDTVDFLAANCLGSWAAQFPEKALPVIHRYTQSENFWLVRAAILHQLTYKKATDTNLLAATIVPHLSAKEFFIRKAIGWALRQYARTAPDWVTGFVEAHPEMQPLSRREALKHL